ncbi:MULTISPECIES: DUF1993 family protein [unclassified Sphingobium]|uniref:DUF1993 domain-containing protein n=1 Tax=unclassified Sphingobium TaxID=2611147 RepID=UPI0022246705|nr:MULTISPECIES: DUF1993 domain-containing protein [unclassified Sphingobium]MCW2410309.1 hypothetical protein [Sphingobium sp. B8D3D]MCW2413999.1 hypothetical protein [Sphingobium sp. B8D3A]
MSLTASLVPTYRQMLRTLSGLLDKAEQQMPAGARALLAARLAPDMYPLAAQIRFAALQAQEALFRLRGQPLPAALVALAAEGQAAVHSPGSLAQARARLTEALAALDALPSGALDAGDSLPIALDLPGGLAFDMTGEDYARDWALPQFYFHVVTAYAILRKEGVEIGKADYVPHMFAYLRRDDTPAVA